MLRACALALLCSACPTADFVGVSDDGGPDGGGLGNASCGPDAGPSDGGACDPASLAAACDALVSATCADTCHESPGCAASQLLRDHEPYRCPDALADTQTFPHCTLGDCDALVAKACGGSPALPECADAPGCAPALELQARTRDPAATQDDVRAAQDTCVQGLEDEVVFARCP